MIWAGITLVAVGILLSAFKGYVVWDIAHDPFNGGGAPTLDFPVFCPIPLAAGTNLVLSALGLRPFPGFGFVVYICLAASFGFLLSWFYRVGVPERQRQLRAIERKAPPGAAAEPGAAADRTDTSE